MPEMMRGGEQHFSADRRDARQPVGVEERRLLELLRRQPDLEQFAPPSNRARAARAYAGASRFLGSRPHLLDELGQAAQANPDALTMLVFPEQPLVVAREGKITTLLAPVLTCTMLALDDLFFPGEEHGIIVSGDGLAEHAWNAAAAGQGHISYEGSWMDPADYVALAVKTFYNETFRRVRHQR